MMAWFLEFGPKVAPLPPTTAGPDSGIFEASIAWLGPWAFKTGTQSASGKAVTKAKAKRTARFMRTSAVLLFNRAEGATLHSFRATFGAREYFFFKGSLVAVWSQRAERQRR
jgi:hypothetical protein